MAWALVAILGVLAIAASTWLVATRSKLTAQRAATATAAKRAADVEADAAEAEQAHAEAIESLRAELGAVTAQAEQSERRRMSDAAVLWSLERARSERAWRFSVAVGPDSVSALGQVGPDETSRALVEALRVELDAAREEVGAVVELDADVPEGVAPAAAITALRIAQELLAGVVRRSESTTLRVSVDGDDLVVAVDSVDEEGNPVVPAPLPLPPSPGIGAGPDAASIRIVGAAARPPDAP